MHARMHTHTGPQVSLQEGCTTKRHEVDRKMDADLMSRVERSLLKLTTKSDHAKAPWEELHSRSRSPHSEDTDTPSPQRRNHMLEIRYTTTALIQSFPLTHSMYFPTFEMCSAQP